MRIGYWVKKKITDFNILHFVSTKFYIKLKPSKIIYQGYSMNYEDCYCGSIDSIELYKENGK